MVNFLNNTILDEYMPKIKETFKKCGYEFLAIIDKLENKNYDYLY
jgi:hypothetical protein